MVSRKKATLFIFFVLSYLFLWFFSMASVFIHSFFEKIPLINLFTNAFFPLAQWNLSGFPFIADYMLLLIPFAGFFFIYFLIDWTNNYFNSKIALSFWFPLTLIVFSLISWLVVLIFYFGNISYLNPGREVNFDYFLLFRNSAFYVFVLSGLLAWVSKKLMIMIDERK